jgi:hypothetical protein
MSKPKAKPIPYLFRGERPPAGGAKPVIARLWLWFFGIFLESTVPVFMDHLSGLPFPGFFGSFRLGGLFRPDPEVAPYSGCEMDDDDFGEDQ